MHQIVPSMKLSGTAIIKTEVDQVMPVAVAGHQTQTIEVEAIGHQSQATMPAVATSSVAGANMTRMEDLTMNSRKRVMPMSRTTLTTWTSKTIHRRMLASSISAQETAQPHNSRRQQICSEAAQVRPSPPQEPLSSEMPGLPRRPKQQVQVAGPEGSASTSTLPVPRPIPQLPSPM